MKHLETLFERALDAVVGMDATGAVTAWNGAAERMFGWSRSEALGSSMSELVVPPQHREAHVRGLAHYNRTGEGPVLEKRVLISAIDRNGYEFPVELSIFPLRDDTGLTSFYAFIRSLAVEEAARRELELRAREAEALLSVARKLLSDISMEEFTRFCLDTICSIAGMEAGHLHMVRGKGAGAHLHPTGVWHLASQRFQPIMDVTNQMRFSAGEGLPGLAWQKGELQAIQDLSESRQFLRRDVFADVGLSRAVALPVWQSGEVRGVLEFYGTAKARLDAEILRMIQTIGNQIAVAIWQKEQAEYRETLRREMSHRVGNSLTVLASIYRICSRASRSKDDLDESFLGRITSIAKANRLAVENASEGLHLSDLIRQAVDIFPEADNLLLDVDELVVSSDSVMPLSLILSELATNSLKHSGESCRISIGTTHDTQSDIIVLDWKEARSVPSGPDLNASQRVGFGTKLIQLMVEDRLGGSFERSFSQNGVHVILRLPRNQLAAS